MTVEIRQCREVDVPAVMAFLDAHWAKGHVLSTHRALMDWQHASRTVAAAYNWMIAIDAGGVEGVLGFVPTAHFDPALAERPFTWLALWKIRPAPENHGLGLQLLQALGRQSGGGAIGVLGINPAHPPMYRALGYQVGALEHSFVCAADREPTLIAAPPAYTWPTPRPGVASFVQLDVEALGALRVTSTRVPSKTPQYFANRYLAHPVYHYKVFGIRLQDTVVALVATRVATHASARVLRLVDFVGDEAGLAESGSAMGRLLADQQCEYADLWQWGLQTTTLERCGFRRVPGDGTVIVPNYFEPFLQKNARIEFAVKGIGDAALALFRGDGDQDRPNRIDTT